MEVYLLIPLYLGLLFVACTWLWLLVCTFRQSIWWGLGSVIVPPLALWFAVRHARETVKPLVWIVAASVLAVSSAPLFIGYASSRRITAKNGQGVTTLVAY